MSYKVLFLFGLIIPNIILGQRVFSDSLVSVELLFPSENKLSKFTFNWLNDAKTDFIVYNNNNKTIDTLHSMNLLVDSIMIELIKSDLYSKNNIITELGINADWLSNNKDCLISLYKRNDGKKSRCMKEKLDSISVIKSACYRMVGPKHDQRSPIVTFQLRFINSTITIRSSGDYPFMLPWVWQEDKLFSPNISKCISNFILNNDYFSQLLKGESDIPELDWESNLLNNIYLFECSGYYE